MLRSKIYLFSLVTCLLATMAFSAGTGDPIHVTFGLKYEVVPPKEGVEGNSATLKFIPENFSKQKDVEVFVERMNQAPKTVRSLTINDKNEIVFTNDPDKVFSFPLEGFVPGEPLRIGLFSKDGKERVFISMTPTPIEVWDNKGRHFSLELESADGRAFKFIGEGFDPKESLVLISKTGKKTLRKKLSPTTAGRFSGTLRPSDGWKKSGTSRLEISGKTGSLWLNFDWGEAGATKGETI